MHRFALQPRSWGWKKLHAVEGFVKPRSMVCVSSVLSALWGLFPGVKVVVEFCYTRERRLRPL